MPWSMTLYFVDIASIHILILKVNEEFKYLDTIHCINIITDSLIDGI